jgi:YVTN family beta-propeller protein
VCSSFTAETDVVAVSEHRIVGRITQASPFCPNIAASPDGRQVWFTLKDTGRTQVFQAQPPFALLTTLETGPISNHVNFARNPHGLFAYVTVGGLDEVKVFRTRDFRQVATIAVGALPHGLWPSADGTRMYVGLENDDRVIAIDTLSNTVTASIPVGQAPQALVYVPGAVPEGAGLENLQPLGLAGQAVHLALAPLAAPAGAAPTTRVTLFEQGLTQVLQASVNGLAPRQPYQLAFCALPDGSGPYDPLADFVTNPAGSAIVNAVGPIRQIVESDAPARRRYLVIVSKVAPQEPAIQLQVASTPRPAAAVIH